LIKIWHNNRCSKSREAKKILEERNIDFEVFEYLKEDISKDMIQDVMKKLKVTDIKDMLRDGEDEYSLLDIKNKTQNEIIDIVVNTPKLIQRPIIIKGDKAVIARPIQNLQDLL
jgi:arsenate reductase